MTSLIAIASKQVQLQELVACIRHFDVQDVKLRLFNHQGRISPDGARNAIGEVCPDTKLDVGTFAIDDRRAIAEILDQPADIVAFPLYRASALYRRVPSLRRRSSIVHITDGLGDLFTMWELQRAVIAKTRMALLKGALVIPQLALLRADLEFNLFHPMKTPYAKKSLPVGPFPITRAKREALDNLLKRFSPEALVIDGFDLKAEHIAAELGIDSYVATRRDGGIDINGQTYLEDEIICAEEVLAMRRPSLVVGCPSTSLAAARALDGDIPTFCLTTAEALRIRGPRFNVIFQAYGERFGIIFSEAENIRDQLSDFRERLPGREKACA